MVLGTILDMELPNSAQQMKHPVPWGNVMYAGLIEEDLRPMDQSVHTLGIKIAKPEDLADNSDTITEWIKDRGITN